MNTANWTKFNQMCPICKTNTSRLMTVTLCKLFNISKALYKVDKKKRTKHQGPEQVEIVHQFVKYSETLNSNLIDNHLRL